MCATARGRACLTANHSQTSCHVHSESAHQAESNRRRSGHDHPAGTCGGLWLGGSLAHATNGASLDSSAPCTTEAAVCFASASRSSSSTSTPSRRSAPRTQELRDRDAGAPLATIVPLCVPTLVHTFLSGCMRLLSCCAVHISIPPEYYISGRVPQGG